MSENNFSLINLDGLPQATADIANKLIDKISSALGWLTEPFQRVRLAKANSEARLIEEITNLQIEHLKKNFPAPDSQAFVARLLGEERKKQENTLSIIKKAIPFLKETAKPQDIDNDWILNFHDKSKLISEESMQVHWARILAGEANQAGSFSKRTVNFMADLDKRDAEAFTDLCAFKWEIDDRGIDQFIFIPDNYVNNTNLFSKVNFDFLVHLESLNLIKMGHENYQFRLVNLAQQIRIKYIDLWHDITFNSETDNQIETGILLLTPIAKELSKICTPTPIPGFEEYTLEELKKQGCTILKTT